MKRLLPLILLISLQFPLFAKQYFQQEVKYTIHVKLNDRAHSLSAMETIVYINHSPDTLSFIWFHLWPNGYASPNTALAVQKAENNDPSLLFATDADRGYIDSIDFKWGQQKLDWSYHPVNHDICKINLPSVLLPGDSISINTPFYVKIPSGRFSRLGHIGQAYAISQWYPKPAVYDRDGWHEMPYLDQGEFYSEYGSFDVSVTLPSNYVLGATGDRVDGEQEEQWMDSLAAVNDRQNAYGKDMSFPPSDTAYKTLRFHQDLVHDFAWFADKRFHVGKSHVTLPRTNHTVTTWALFTNNEAALWKKAAGYVDDALKYYSQWVGDYPYRQCTAVDGTIAAGGGMEYPNITIIGSSGNDSTTLEATIAHEVGHNWFYGLLGSNERDHAWMDEGINSYYEMRYYMTKYPPSVYGSHNDLTQLGNLGHFFGISQLTYRQAFSLEYALSASSNTDQPIETRSVDFTMLNYGTVLYRKTGIVFQYLHDYLGETVFDSCMQQYFTRWKYHHPQPQDLKSIFIAKDSTLNWFFDDLLNSSKKQDDAIRRIKTAGDSTRVFIRHKGGITAPVPVAGFQKDKLISTVWTTGNSKHESVNISCAGCDKFVVDPDHTTLDYNTGNNAMRRYGILRKVPPLKINLVARYNDPVATRIFWLPALGYNNYNKLMPGIILHNQFVPVRKIEYAAAFLYGTADHKLAGTGMISRNFFPQHGFSNSITVKLAARRFAYEKVNYPNNDGGRTTDYLHYNKLEPSVTINLRPAKLRSPNRDLFIASGIFLNNETVNYTPVSTGYAGNIIHQKQEFYRLAYQHLCKRVIDPWNLQVKTDYIKKSLRADATVNYRFSYPNYRKGVDIRLFGGYVFNEQKNYSYGYSLSDRSSYNQDFAFDEWYFGRTESSGLLSRQIAIREGGFKAANPLGSYRQWIAAVNISADFPGLLPLRFFADIGTYSGLKKDLVAFYDVHNNVSADAGVSVVLVKDVVEVYFPFFRTAEIKKYESVNNLKFSDQIRFTFNIAKLNLLNIRNQFLR